MTGPKHQCSGCAIFAPSSEPPQADQHSREMPGEEPQTSTFSTSGEDVIVRPIEVYSEETPTPGSSEFDAYYEIDKTLYWIAEGGYKRIALQFPDDLLHDSVPVYQALQKRLDQDREAYVLADTSYGSCCVDEVAASHVESDALVHYGHACLSQTSRLPVMYIFGRKSLDIESCVDKISTYVLANAEDLQDFDVIHLRHSVGFAHHSEDLVRLLRLVVGDRYRVDYDPLSTHTSPALQSSGATSQCCAPSDAKGIPSPEDISPVKKKLIVWVGEESPTLTKLLMTSSGSNIISYSPSSRMIQLQSHLTNKLLMRRYALLQKARDADVFGILIGTLGVASYLPLTKHLRLHLKQAHKKSYTVSVGKINPSKLANFMEIECWIWVACSEGMVDSKDYLRPIITPFELELALQAEPDWTGHYVFDFQELLAKTSSIGGEEADDDLGSDQPRFSLVSGKYRHAKRYGDASRNEEGESDTKPRSQSLTSRSQENALVKTSNNAAAHFLQARSYQGLEARIGQDTPSILEQGRSGIARGYEDDHKEGSAIRSE